jgi:hypothetical protein
MVNNSTIVERRRNRELGVRQAHLQPPWPPVAGIAAELQVEEAGDFSSSSPPLPLLRGSVLPPHVRQAELPVAEYYRRASS